MELGVHIRGGAAAARLNSVALPELRPIPAPLISASRVNSIVPRKALPACGS